MGLGGGFGAAIGVLTGSGAAIGSLTGSGGCSFTGGFGVVFVLTFLVVS